VESSASLYISATSTLQARKPCPENTYQAITAATNQSGQVLEHTILGTAIAEAGSNSQALLAMAKMLRYKAQQPNWGYQQSIMF